MKTKPLLSALAFSLLALPLTADTFTLKDGSTLEGVIVKEEGDNYILEVQVTKTIKDERKIAKSEIVKIGREQPDLKAFEVISKSSPAPDLMTEDDYVLRISAVEKFLKEHRGSAQTKDAKAILENLKSEANVVSGGGIKLNGKMVSPEDYKTNAYELDARVQEAKIRSLIDQNLLLPALRAFADFDGDFRSTLAYGTLAPQMRQVIQGYVAEARQSLATLDARLKDRAVGFQRMDSESRKATELAVQEEATAIEARYKAEKEAKQAWVTTSPFHKAAFEDTVRFGDLEIARLAAVKTVLGVDGGKAYRELWNVVQRGGNAASVTTSLAAAKTANVPARYVAPLEAAAKGRK